jgi:iron complex transport system substrate-binding protein
MAGCSEQRTIEKEMLYQKEIEDCMGRKVKIPSKVEKVVDLALLDGTRTMVELGVSDKLVGINDFVRDFMYGEEGKAFACWFAAPKAAPQLKNLLSVGSYREPNIEMIKSLEPDVILAYASRADFPETLERQMGIPVVCIRASGCLDFRMLRLVGEICGNKDRAEGLVSYARKKTEKITRMVSHIPETERVNVFFWGWPVQGAPKTIAPYDPIDLAGGVNVAMQTGFKPYEIYDITKEQLAVWNPDVILLQWWTKKKVGVRVETILSDPALQTVSGVKSGRVFYSRSFMKGWDPAMGVCEVYYMAKLFYPRRFLTLNVEKECNDILKQFYGVSELYSDLIGNSELHAWE